MKRNWEYKKLGEVCEILNGYAFKSQEYVDHGIRVIRITNVQKGHVIDDDPKFYPLTSESSLSNYMLVEDDLLMSLTGNVGRVGLLGKEFLPAALNQRVACLRIRSASIDKKFLFHILNSDKFEKDCIFNASGIAQKNMSTRWLGEYVIPVPPLEEQSRIVAELDLLTGIIDKQNAQLKELDNLAQAIFYDMFGDPIENPKGWEVKPLGNIGKIVTGNTPSRLVKEYYESPFIEWIKSDNLSNDFMYASKAKEYLSESGALKGRVLPIGSVLVTCIAGSISTIGTASSIDRKVAFNQQINAIIPNEHIVQTLYLLYTIRLMGGVIRANATNGMKHIITKSVFEKIPFILPPLALQQSFAEKIQSIEKQKETIRASIADTQKLLDYTMDKYFG